MYVSSAQSGSGVHTSDSVKSLWLEAKSDLEECSASIEICADFPAVMMYETPSSHWPTDIDHSARLPDDWNSTEQGTLIAHGWEDFLRGNSDPNFHQ